MNTEDRKKIQKIIVVDDDAEFLEELTHVLTEAGYDVTALDNCQTILDTVYKVNPDVVMLDMKLRSMSGFEGASAIRFLSPAREVPIIMMSGVYYMQDQDFFTRFCGIKKFLRKPFSPREAIDTIEGVLKEAESLKTKIS